MRRGIAVRWTALIAVLVFVMARGAAAAVAGGGVCVAPGAGGGLYSGLGLGSSLLPGLLGGGGSAAGCMPGEPASVAREGPSTLAGNPVDVVTGAKHDRAIDLQLALPAVRPVSRAPDALGFLFARMHAGASTGSDAFGPGWTHSYATRLHRVGAPSAQGELQVLQADGRLVKFSASRAHGPGTRRFVAGRRGDGVLDLERGAGVEAWVWHWRNGRELRFREDGRLVAITEPGGIRLALAYDEQARLVSVSDAGGREIRLSYAMRSDPASLGPAPSRVVTLTGPQGARLDYAYDEHGRLAAVRHADGAQVRYRYAGGLARLSSVVLPDGSASEYRYDEAGRVTYSRAAGQDDRDALTLAYEADVSGASGLTLLAQGGRERARYRWVQSDGAPLLASSEGDGCAGCPSTGVRYGYRGGEIAWVAREHTRYFIERDRAGRMTAILRATADANPLVPANASANGVPPARELRGDAATRPVLRIRWSAHPLIDRPERITRPSQVAGAEHTLRFHYDDVGRIAALSEDGFAPAVVPGPRDPRVAGARPIRRVLHSSHPPVQLDAGGPLTLPPDARQLAPGQALVERGPGRSTRYWLDDFGRIVASHSPEAGLSRWQYDASGRIDREYAADGALARYRYDRSGQLTERIVSGGRGSVVTRYAYAAGRLSAVDHPHQSETYTYDGSGRLKRRAVALRSGAGRSFTFDTHYRYDASTGHLVAKSLPDGSWLLLSRDPAGQVTALRRAWLEDDSAEPHSTGRGAALVADGAMPMVEGLVRTRAGLTGARFGNGATLRVQRALGGKPSAICHRSPAAPVEACDLLDHKLEFDGGGRLVRWSRGRETAVQRYGDDGALLASEVIGGEFARSWRFEYGAASGAPSDANKGADANGGKDANHGNDSSAGNDTNAASDAAGRRLGGRGLRYRWSDDGLLAEVIGPDGPRAQYRYNHRGERVSRRTPGGLTQFLYDEARRLQAEVDADGRITRQFVHLADLPVAIIDSRPGGERIAWLHLNHLGAPEVATDSGGRLIWSTRYAPFGRSLGPDALPGRAPGAPSDGFDQPLRLPGQYEDAESGLHYNDHRYYDPDAGRYLSPDPLGVRGGHDLHGYAANDPLSNVDPTGLLLFAFDGTGNSDPPPRRDDWSNVYKLARSYADGRVWYMAGVGRADAASGISGDLSDPITAYTARARVDHMLAQLDQAARDPGVRGQWLDIDVIGFSRGAAMGRDFTNRVAERIADGAYQRLGACVRLRFLGLWDTVAQFGVDGAGNFAWKLSVPTAVAYTAHAVALNEHRMLFPGESIVGSPLAGVRVERGFIGAHADVGGSYAEGDLSDVALNWMHRQATLAGARMFALTSELTRVDSPLLHDSRGLVGGDREFRYRTPSGWTIANPMQRVARVDGMQWQDTGRFIDRFAQRRPDAYGDPTIAGLVDIAAYSNWLRVNYALVLGVGP